MKAYQKEYDIDYAGDTDQYNEMLNEISCIENLPWDYCDVLKAMDPIAYRVGFSDWTGTLEPVWVCEECGDEFDDEDDANGCCMFRCEDCDTLHDSEQEAEICCEKFDCSTCGAEYDDEKEALECCENEKRQ